MLLTVFKTEAVGLALETGFCLRVSVYLLSVFQEYTTLLQVGKVFPKKPKDPTSFPDFSPTLRLEEEYERSLESSLAEDHEYKIML